MRRSLLAKFSLIVAGATGCLLTADFDRFDTSPPTETTDAGPPDVVSATIALGVDGATTPVRPASPGRIAITVTRSGNAAAAPVRVRLDGLPAGLVAKELTVPAAEGRGAISIEAQSAAAIAPLLGKTVTVNVVGATDDGTSVSSTTAAVEVWGAPGQIDPTRGSGALAFDINKVIGDRTVANVPIRVADFVGSTLVVGIGREILTLDANGSTQKIDVGVVPAAEASAYDFATTVTADDTVLNAVATKVHEPLVGPDLEWDVRLRRGPLSALVAKPVIPGGSRCTPDREGLRMACRSENSDRSFTTRLRRVDGATPGEIVRVMDGLDVTTIHHDAHGWLLLGLRYPVIATPFPGTLLALVDDSGAPVPAFAFTEATGAYFDGVIDASGIYAVGTDSNGATAGKAIVVKHSWSGAVDPAFASGAPLELPGYVVMRIAASKQGFLAGSVTSPPYVGSVARFSATGALDPTFGEKGVVTLPGYTGPVAIREVGSRILVGILTETGARVVHLFP